MEEKKPKRRGRPPNPVKELSFVAPKETAHPDKRHKNGYTSTYPQVKGGGELSTGGNSAIALWSMELINISKRADRNDPETLRQCFVDYIQACVEKDHKISNLGAYMAMGISRMTASAWRTGKVCTKDSSYRELIEYVDLICAQAREELIMDGKINPVIGIFWQKNYDNFKDNVDLSVANNPLEVSSSAAEIAEKYQDIPD